MKNDESLAMRLYRDEVLWEVARLVGHGGIPAGEVEQRIAPLVERFGRSRVEAVLWKLTTYQAPEETAVALRSYVRPLCWQLLGPPPEHPERKHYDEAGPWVPPWERQAAQAPKKGKGQPKPRGAKTGREARKRKAS